MTLAELKHRESFERANPVVIAGYGRESTHKGYLSWIFDGSRNPLATEALGRLIKQVSARGFLDKVPSVSSLSSVSCRYEEPYGGKVDLLVRAKVGGGHELQVPIELKTDSDLYEDQFKKMSDHAKGEKNEKTHVICCAFLLGTSALKLPLEDRRNRKEEAEELHDFVPITPTDLVNAWEDLMHERKCPGYLKDWLEAVGSEKGRHEMAFQLCNENWDPGVFWEQEQWRIYGYRGYNSMMQCALNGIRQRLLAVSVIDYGRIYLAQHNAVLSLEFGDPVKKWYKTGVADLWWFIEFNNEKLVLKTGREASVSVEQVEKWCEKVWQDRLVGTNANRAKKRAGKTWRSIAQWACDFRKPDDVLETVRKVARAMDI